MRLFTLLRHGEPCGFIQFKRTQNALGIVRMKCGCRFRVDLLQAFQHRFSAKFCKLPFQTRTVLRWFTINKPSVAHHCINIKACAADQDRNLSARKNVVDARNGKHLILCNAERLCRIEKRHQMMRHTLHLLQCRLRRCNAHTAVNLHGICGNNFAVKRFGKRNAKGCFTACSGSSNHKNLRFHVYSFRH